MPIGQRLADALVAYVGYLGQFFWPANLVPFYPRPAHGPPAWQTFAAAAILLAISAAATVARKRRPWLFVGWFWFVGTLVPMIGLVPIGAHRMADRYTYVTQIGLCIIVAWGLARLVAVWPRCRAACASASLAMLIMLAAAAWLQTAQSRNSKTLWAHMLECYPRQAIGYSCFGAALLDEGRSDKAIEYFRTALTIDPCSVEALTLLGNVAAGQGKYAEAADYLGLAVKLDPHHVRGMNNYALALVNLGETERAIKVLRSALAVEPDSPIVNNSLGSILASRGKLDAAAECLESSRPAPRNADAHDNLGSVLRRPRADRRSCNAVARGDSFGPA